MFLFLFLLLLDDGDFAALVGLLFFRLRTDTMEDLLELRLRIMLPVVLPALLLAVD